ncbi:MAG TPA: ureidoglycolate lyase [Aestuariivirga sp.]|jgi:ureidoglycolate lyase|nr:ureidoglycolate lyase [Aestuariivirga sp.]
MITLKPEPLTKASFAPFGDVIEIEGAQHFPINQGFAERFNDLARVDVGEVNISIVTAKVRPKPIGLKLMERHPLGSQIFYPLQDRPWLVVVCVEPQDSKSFRVFRATGRQGINYARNTWHFPLLVLEDGSRFLVVDRKGPGNNLQEVKIDEIRLDVP